ncbi:MAG: RNA polymerase sigma factor [Clostridia bacterium]|nr:RNA polymerase sigma factor [Clostridia bacterium]
MQDKELIALMNDDPGKGLRVAMDLYGGAVKTIMCAFLAGFPEEDIDEAVADCFVALWQTAKRFDANKGTLKSFIYGIARNCAKHKCRSLRRRRMEQPIEEGVSFASPENVEAEVIEKMQAGILLEMIEALSEPARSVFIFRYIEHKSVAETAQLLQISEKKVENILYRERKKLKKAFEEGRGML